MQEADARKRIRARALRLRRALASEQKEFGAIHDGAGKRYLIGPLFVQSGDIEAALDHYRWYERHCPDDSGDPIDYLFWALALHRAGMADAAGRKLLEASVKNIYLLSITLHLPFEAEDIWHPSNKERPGYILEAPSEFVPILLADERKWMMERVASERFRAAREEYVATFGALRIERDFEKRCMILDRWDQFQREQVRDRL